MNMREDGEKFREKIRFDRKAGEFAASHGMEVLATFSGMPEGQITAIVERKMSADVSDFVYLTGIMELIAERDALRRLRDIRAYVERLLTSGLGEIDEAGGFLDEKDLEQIELLRGSMVNAIDRNVSLLEHLDEMR